MPDYSKAKIYKLSCNITNKEYYGSTTQKLNARLRQHKADAKRRTGASKQIIDGGDYHITLMEDYPCETKLGLLKKERYYIENNKCVNKELPSRTEKEYNKQYAIDNKDRLKQCRIDNKDKLKMNSDKHYADNRDEINRKHREYYAKNKDELNRKSREYYNNNKDRFNIKDREYRVKNKDEIKKYQKEYRIKNKDKITQKKKEYYIKTKELKKLKNAELVLSSAI